MRRRAASPPHRLQKRRVGVLQRQVQVARHAPARRERSDELGRDPVGIGVEDPDPAETVDVVERPQEMGGVGAVLEVGPVVGRVLGNQVDLDHALRRQAPGFFDDRGDRPRALQTAEGRDGAERAGVVAPLRDLEVGGMHRRRQQAW